ncbi:MAG: 3-hydroxyacyl-CoA dehydrogenase, partial [Proteobacteria bacterium]|nr:3-hydroxyacyl-CoA dehydrogenase [Pseudomonadota bacterium]
MSGLDKNSVVAVIGAGTMGAGIAQVAATAGHPVLLFDAQDGAAKAGISKLDKGLQGLLERRKISAETKKDILERIQVVDKLEDISPAELVIEAIVEDLGIKQAVFKTVQAFCAEKTILASNTSSISITEIGAALEKPENLVGMHFFNPAQILKLVEVVSGLATTKSVAERVYQTAGNWGKKPVFAKSTPGFIVNRVARPFYAESLRLLQEGAADVSTLDAIMRESGGFRMGPFELMDLIGLDVNFAVTNTVFSSYFSDPRFSPSLIQQELVAAGRLGRKSGQGFYDYQNGENAKPVEVVPDQLKIPAEITVFGDLGVAEPLLELAKNKEIKVNRQAGEGVIQLGDCTLVLSNGLFATVHAQREKIKNLVFFDLALDYASCQRIAICAADQTSDSAIKQARDFFSAIGKQVSMLDDIPGMAVMRTVCMLANEAADTVNQQVCQAEDIDIAMQAGVNYPCGPLQWADQLTVD